MTTTHRGGSVGQQLRRLSRRVDHRDQRSHAWLESGDFSTGCDAPAETGKNPALRGVRREGAEKDRFGWLYLAYNDLL